MFISKFLGKQDGARVTLNIDQVKFYPLLQRGLAQYDERPIRDLKDTNLLFRLSIPVLAYMQKRSFDSRKEENWNCLKFWLN